MAFGSIGATTRTVTAPEALRAPLSPTVRRGETENTTSTKDLEKVAVERNQEERRTSREDKDNGSSVTDLYQAPSVKQTQPQNKPTGTLVNVTA